MTKGKKPGSPDSPDYEVGYGRPPTESRFRPGESGNPAGRRRGVRNLKTDVIRTLGTPIKVKEGGRTRIRSTQEGALMLLREQALRGDGRAIKLLFELALRFNTDAAEMGPAQPLSPDDQAILAAFVAERTTPLQHPACEPTSPAATTAIATPRASLPRRRLKISATNEGSDG